MPRNTDAYEPELLDLLYANDLAVINATDALEYANKAYFKTVDGDVYYCVYEGELGYSTLILSKRADGSYETHCGPKFAYGTTPHQAKGSAIGFIIGQHLCDGYGLQETDPRDALCMKALMTEILKF